MLIHLSILLSLLAAPPIKAPPKPFTLEASVEGISAYRLPNGLQVLLFPDPSKPTTVVNLTVFAGNRQENYGEKGLAHLFEHMLFKKTKHFKSIKEELTRLGGSANGTTWYDRTNYFEIFPADEAKLGKALELEAERLRMAVISREELATEMGVVRNELDMGENNPLNILSQRLLAAAFEWHNYGKDTIGPASDIEKVPNERLLAWYDTYYQPDNAMLVVAGKFDPEKALRQIANTFGKIPRPKRALPVTYTVEPTQDGERSVTVRRTGGTPLLLVGYHIPAGTDPDFAAIDVLDRVLGDAPAGRLYQALVETKKAAKVSCGNFQLREPGYAFCQAELQAKDPVEAVKMAMLSVLEGTTQKPITAEEVERAKANIMKQYELLFNSTDRLGIVLSEFAAMGDWRMLFLHRDRTEKVTVEDVNRVAAKYLKPSNRTLGEYVPTEKPDRSEIPAMADVGQMLKGYQGRPAAAVGETFDASPKNIDARTVRSVLKSGMRVALLSKKTHGETVRGAIQLNFGTEKSLADRQTAAEFAAKMLLRGTKSKTRQQVKDLLDKQKAQVQVVPTAQGVVIRFEVRRSNLNELLALIAECVQTPAFDAKEFEELRRETLSKYEQNKDDPMQVGFNGTQRLLNLHRKGHPLYHPTFQELITQAQAVTLDQAKQLHGRFYGSQDGFVAMAGDFDAKETSDRLAALFGAWKATEPYMRIPDPFVPVAAQDLVVPLLDKPMAFFGAGVPFALKDDHPDYPAMLMANYLLGGGFLNGRVTKRLREKDGFSYHAGTFLGVSGYDDSAALMGFAIYGAANREKVEQGFREELGKAVLEGFSKDELDLAREGLLKEREQSRAMDEQVVMQLIELLELDRTMAFEQKIDDKLKTLTLAEVSAALKKYVDLQKLSVLKVGDFKAAPAAK